MRLFIYITSVIVFSMSALTEIRAAKGLAALGNTTRLRLLKLLVKAGIDGLNIGQIQAHLAVPASTLAHHIAALVQAGLLRQSKQGREVICRADYGALRGLSAYLLDECCAGVEVDTADDAA